MSKSRMEGGTMRIRTYQVVELAVEEGVAEGIRRAHEHGENPGRDVIQDKVFEAVMTALCDVIDFGDPGGNDE